MFHLSELVFRYPGPRPARPTIDLSGVRLDLPISGTLVLLGESGSGKTTLLSLLGLLWDRPAESGELTYGGVAPARGDTRTRAILRRSEFGFVLQSAFLLPHFTVSQNVAVPLELAGIDAASIRERVGHLLGAAGLSDLARRRARTLSGGQRQRVAVLRALAHDPRVVFADEPVSNLDRQNAEVVLDLLARWRLGSLFERQERRDRLLVLVSHSLRQARKIADGEGMALLLHEGRLVGGRPYPLAQIDDATIYRATESGLEPGTGPQVSAAEVSP
ncbi:ABC transporter ATP-binding protein [Tautonia plasticadhaerens]|uniref:Lipoprotein-releasing system ATP-binding protein LolD n=1 Tax=Tautonia plasticadhaerens TaxID=2527974 RepID=A0A518H637_9BACT|nr:ATP-binding cassette domain-containing protein [Tautonia plasticadhaerens]QDV36304.1 Lipoprotein-releasing system ATP-binding protein LolD [Tautonia plasticadhaerens]